MPYTSIDGAKKASFPTSAEGIALTLPQINKLAEIYDALKEEGKVDNPMAVAWNSWKQVYEKKGGKWAEKEKKPAESLELFYRGDDFSKIDFEGGVRFKKDLIPVGSFLHPQDRTKKIVVTKERMQKWIDAFENYKKVGGDVHIPLRHSDDPDKNTGWLEKLLIENDKLMGIVEITEPEIAEKIERKTIKGASISITPDFLDEKGNAYDEMLDHVALTVIPQIRGQGPFVRLESGEFESLISADERGNQNAQEKEVITMEEDIKQLKEQIAGLEKEKAELEEKAKVSENVTLETLKKDKEKTEKEVAELKGQVTKLEEEKVEREKIEMKARIEELVKDGKLPPAVRDKVGILLEADWSKPIHLEEKDKDGNKTERDVTHKAMIFEIFANLPKYAGFKEETVTESKVEMEEEEAKKIGRETAESVTGTSKSKELEAKK